MQIAATKKMLTILESCQISPPPATIGNRSLPITFFDVIWLPHFPINQLFFYEFPHSRTHFIEKVVPNLKHSLSITLQHFFPFAGNLLVFPKPNDSGFARKPEIRYVEGDSVAFTLVECDLDFDDRVGNHPRACDKFYPLLPSLGHVVKESDFAVIPLFAVQVTFYENLGFSIGITNHHVLCDASTKYDFLMAWTSIARHGTDELFLAKRSNFPVYDRLIKYPDSFDQMFLKESRVETLNLKYQLPELIGPSCKVRATFIMTKAKINLIKNWVSGQVPTLGYMSSFSVTCAYVWSCIAKSRAEVEGVKGEDELERFVCVANLRGNKGFLVAVESLGEAISKTVKNKDELLKNDELWFEMLFKIPAKIPAKIGVAGTPKVKIYDIDFGWGKPKKYETISIDCNGSITVNACKKSPDDLEIGLSLPDKQMDAFIAIFDRELQSFL